MIELGDKVKDTVSGFIGIVIGKHAYLQGCIRITIQPPVDKDGKLPESHIFDELELKVLKAKKVVVKKSKKPGGPMPYKDNPKITPGRRNY